MSVSLAIIENYIGLAMPFERFLSGIPYRIYHLWDNEFPEEPLKYKAYILTGDVYNITDIQKQRYHLYLQKLLNKIIGKSKIYASCFSHQFIAKMYGLKVIHRKSRMFGWQPIYLIKPNTLILDGLPARMYFFMVNGDEVISPNSNLPNGIHLLADNEDCLYQILFYEDSIISVQSHPEMMLTDTRRFVEKHLNSLQYKNILHNTENYARESVNLQFMDNIINWLLKD